MNACLAFTNVQNPPDDKSQISTSDIIREMIELLEHKLPDLYAVKRVNMYLCDHKRQEIYKMVKGEDKVKLLFYSSQVGIAGKVSISIYFYEFNFA